MTTSANESQFDAWNGESGRRWVATADERDRVLAPVGEALLAVADTRPGMRVLDIGCGCGSTTLMAADSVGNNGSAIGIDLSGPMLELARERANAAGTVNASFVQGDAQTHAFEAEAADLIISRFGTMFFADPKAAFANIARALRPGGRLCIATWQPLAANEWLIVPGSALLRHTELPATAGDQPGTAQTAKLANNLMAAAALVITSEAVAMGVKGGVNAKVLVDIINASSGRNSASEDKFPRAVLPGTFDFGFTTGLSYKDVRLCVDEAEAMGVPMVCGAAVRQMLAITNARFGAASDFTSIAKVLEEWAGVQMRG
jgi:ubiquinone/menaquinone biosynthesis C-methylase UbiE